VRVRGRKDLSKCENQSSEDVRRWSLGRRRLQDQLYSTDNFRRNIVLLNLPTNLKTNVHAVRHDGISLDIGWKSRRKETIRMTKK
jgi:hypothetical protein